MVSSHILSLLQGYAQILLIIRLCGLFKMNQKSSICILGPLYRLFLKHDAKIASIYTMEPPQYCRTLIFVNNIIIFTDFILMDICLDNSAAEGACLFSFVLQPLYSAKYR